MWQIEFTLNVACWYAEDPDEPAPDEPLEPACHVPPTA